MSYARKWHLDAIQSSGLVILTHEAREGSRPCVLFDVSTEGNVHDAFNAVYRALAKLPRDAIDLDRADAVLAALGIVHESVDAVPELRRAG